MKVLNKVKKVLIAIGLFFVSISGKVFATPMQPLNIIENDITSPKYRVQHPIESNFFNLFQFVFIPLVLLIGFIVYYKKSKSPKKKKVLIMIIIVLITIIALFLLNWLLEDVYDYL